MFIQRFRDEYEVLKEFGSSIFKRTVIYRNLGSDIHHIQRVGADPTGAICLFQLHLTRKMKTAVEYSDIIQAEKAALKDIVTIDVFPVDPPREIDQQFLKYLFQKIDIPCSRPF